MANTQTGLILWCLWNDTQSVHDYYAKYASQSQYSSVDDLTYLPIVFSNVCRLLIKLPTSTHIYLHSTDEPSILKSIENHTIYRENRDTRYHSFDIAHYENSMYSWINQNKIDTVLVAGLAYNFCVAQCKSVLDKLQRYLSFEYFVVSGCTANLYTDTTNGKKISIFKPVNKIDTKKFIDIEMIK